MGLPKAHGPQSIQIEGLRMPCVLLQTAGDQDGLLFFGAGDKSSKGGSDIIDCLRRAHTDALSQQLLGISHHGTDLESRSRGLARARQAAASHEEESPEARRFGYGYIDTGSRQRAKSGGVRRLSGRVRWRGTPRSLT